MQSIIFITKRKKNVIALGELMNVSSVSVYNVSFVPSALLFRIILTMFAFPLCLIVFAEL